MTTSVNIQLFSPTKRPIPVLYCTVQYRVEFTPSLRLHCPYPRPLKKVPEAKTNAKLLLSYKSEFMTRQIYLCSDLVATLASLHVHNFPHIGCLLLFRYLEMVENADPIYTRKNHSIQELALKKCSSGSRDFVPRNKKFQITYSMLCFFLSSWIQ